MNNAKAIIACGVLLILFCRNDFALPLKTGGNTDGKEKKPPILDYQAKAKLIARFIYFCKWPQDSNLVTPGASLTVGAFEKDDIVDFLIEETKTKKLAGKNAEIVIIKDDETIKKCNLLFINGISKRRLKKILEVVNDLPILTVADEKSYAKRGVMISMFKASNRLAFNVNQTSLLKSGLILHSKALSLAIEIF